MSEMYHGDLLYLSHHICLLSVNHSSNAQTIIYKRWEQWNLLYWTSWFL